MGMLALLLLAPRLALSDGAKTIAVFTADVYDQDLIAAALPHKTRIIVIPPSVDGVSFLAESLAEERDIGALHIFSHGAKGRLTLGSAVLDQASIEGRYATPLASLRASFTANAGILAYGCNFAEGETGYSAANALARATGASVAASDDTTGAESMGGDWILEKRVGEVAAAGIAAPQWPHVLAVTVTTTTNTTTLANAIAAGNSGITLTGTPTLSVGAATNVSGTFSTSGSNLGITTGIVLGTGNITQIPGSPNPAGNLSTAGSGITSGSERDIATFTFSFIPIPGVNRMSIASVFTSEEWNEYVNQGFSDNFTMVLSGGVYVNQNIAVIPGTSTTTDIDNVNLNTNSGYYRNNPPTGSAIPDIRMDGATTVFINAFDVVPGTTYTVTIRIADVGDASYDSAVFVATSTILNNPPSLDLNLSGSGTGYTTTFVQGTAGVAIAANDDVILDDGATISSATITLTNPQANDVLVAGTLPAGITASAYNSGTGVITLSGVASKADYQAALRAITFNNTGTLPAGPNRLINVVINDGVDNSNVAVATIQMATLRVKKSAGAPTVNLGTSNTLTDAGDRITFTYVVQNNGTVNLTAVVPVDVGPSFGGVAGTGTLGAFSPASATVNAGASQTFTAVYTLSAADVVNAGVTVGAVTNTATARGTVSAGVFANSSPSNASTSITAAASLRVTKTAGVPTVALGANNTYTDALDTITFTYVVQNTGSVALTQVGLTDAGPRFDGILGTNTLGAFSPATGGNLPVGGSITYTAVYVLSLTDVRNGVGITNGVTNTANATARNPANVLITATPSNATTTIPAAPRYTITKSYVLVDIPGGTATRADLNETVTYTYSVVNTGNVPINALTVTDMHGTPPTAIPLGVGGITSETLMIPGPYGAAASSNGTANDGIWNIIAPGATVNFSYSHTVTQAEIDNG
jgi:uncharacterized repeat protein (TIGR01451 family)